MKVNRANQTGFAVMYVLVVIAVVMLIATAGWFVRNSTENNKGDSKQDTAKTTETAPNCHGSDTSQFCIERASAEKTKFSKLPVELQAAVKAIYAKQVPSCLKNDQIVGYSGNVVDLDVQYAPVGSAIVAIGCDGSAAGLFAKDLKTGEWKFIEKTQMVFTCDAVFGNPVPKALLSFEHDAQCFKDTTIQQYDDASAERFL